MIDTARPAHNSILWGRLIFQRAPRRCHAQARPEAKSPKPSGRRPGCLEGRVLLKLIGRRRVGCFLDSESHVITGLELPIGFVCRRSLLSCQIPCLRMGTADSHPHSSTGALISLFILRDLSLAPSQVGAVGSACRCRYSTVRCKMTGSAL
ncbi:hypothetical protein MRB53_039386 [Persea americana]|nr:hypothetical protein MRB53_039386 [Persea americana]